MSDLSRFRMKTFGIKGKFEDRSKYFYCWNCGFPCDSKRDLMDLSEHGTGGAKKQEFAHSDYGFSTRMASMESPWMNHESLMMQGPDGGEVDISYSLKPKTVKGCPLCGCTTWAGR
ncbi:MAG TPA: hypothetical protein VMW91_11405 [Desulfosporosinus sp.]|nr:hypothetical protein [Desulfosporosinus sp.]